MTKRVAAFLGSGLLSAMLLDLRSNAKQRPDRGGTSQYGKMGRGSILRICTCLLHFDCGGGHRRPTEWSGSMGGNAEQDHDLRSAVASELVQGPGGQCSQKGVLLQGKGMHVAGEVAGMLGIFGVPG